MRGIVVAVIISTIIEMIIPNGNIKKYIKTVIGVYIMFAIISPIITTLTGKKIDITKYIESQSANYQTKETAKIDTNYYIKQTYIENIKSDVIKEVEAKGYKVNKIQVEMEENDAEYGKLKRLNLSISKIKNGVEPIEISINEKKTKNEEITDEQKSELKVFLETTYGVEQKSIIIN